MTLSPILQSTEQYRKAIQIRDEITEQVGNKVKTFISENPSVKTANAIHLKVVIMMEANQAFKVFKEKMEAASLSNPSESDLSDLFITAMEPYFYSPTLLQREIELMINQQQTSL